MADKLGILPSGNSEPEYISLSDRESEVSPSETLDNFKSDKNTINEIHSAIEEKVEDADIVEEVSEEKGKKDKSRKKAKNKKEKK